eukprot:gene37777-46613_t
MNTSYREICQRDYLPHIARTLPMTRPNLEHWLQRRA